MILCLSLTYLHDRIRSSTGHHYSLQAPWRTRFSYCLALPCQNHWKYWMQQPHVGCWLLSLCLFRVLLMLKGSLCLSHGFHYQGCCFQGHFRHRVLTSLLRTCFRHLDELTKVCLLQRLGVHQHSRDYLRDPLILPAFSAEYSHWFH